MSLKRKRGIALGMILALLPVLLIMVGATLNSVMGQMSLNLGSSDRIQAGYLAEAGVAHAVDLLESTATWRGPLVNQTLAGGGTYSVRFNDSGVGLSDTDSIVNFDGAHNDSYRGPNTVPAGHALIIAVGRVGATTRTMEALVRVGGGMIGPDLPLLTTGNIKLFGNVTVEGIQGVNDWTPINTGIHSNAAAGVNVVSWTGPGSVNIGGNVSATSSDPNAIDVVGNITGSNTSGAAAKPVPSVAVASLVASNSGAPVLPVPPTGNVNAPAGNTYRAGNTIINGDLKLNGGKAYFNGNLTVNGTISGSGSVYVNGETHFNGDTKLSSSTPDKASLFSQGSVVLRGFDGTAYLESISDPTKWALTKTNLQQFQTAMNVVASGTAPPSYWGSGGYLDDLRGGLAPTGGGSTPPDGVPDKLGSLIANVTLQPPSSSKTAVLQRLNMIRDTMQPTSDQLATRNLVKNGIFTYGCFDTCFDDGNVVQHAQQLNRFAQLMSYDQIGRASFQGMVYTNGAFYADNEVSVTGAVVVDGQLAVGNLTVGTETYAPGDLVAKGGTRLTYVEDFFKVTSGASSSTKILIWMPH